MGQINDALGAAGEGRRLTVQGATWHFLPLTKGAQGALEAWMEERAWQKLRAAQATMAPADYRRLEDRLHERIVAGDFGLGSELTQRAIQSGDGLLFFVELMLRPKHPGVNRQDVLALLEADPEGVLATLERLYPKAEAPASQTEAGAVSSP